VSDDLPSQECSEKRCSLEQIEEKREWIYFLEENRKLIQVIDDHSETEKTQIHIGKIEGYNLVLSGKKSTL